MSDEEFPNFFRLHGRQVRYAGPLPSALEGRWPYPGKIAIELASGAHLHWLLADPCTVYLEHGLHAAKLHETKVQRQDRVARNRHAKALQGEARRAKAIQV